jgi:hypothetical protein
LYAHSGTHIYSSFSNPNRKIKGNDVLVTITLWMLTIRIIFNRHSSVKECLRRIATRVLHYLVSFFSGIIFSHLPCTLWCTIWSRSGYSSLLNFLCSFLSLNLNFSHIWNALVCLHAPPIFCNLAWYCHLGGHLEACGVHLLLHIAG